MELGRFDFRESLTRVMHGWEGALTAHRHSRDILPSSEALGMMVARERRRREMLESLQLICGERGHAGEIGSSARVAQSCDTPR